jgi:hypothetical protein
MEGWVSAFVGGHKTVISTEDWDSQVADYFSPLALPPDGFLASRVGKIGFPPRRSKNPTRGGTVTI